MLASPGLVVNATVFILTNIINSTLYVQTPQNVHECYITVDYKNTFNDSWPSQWRLMKMVESPSVGNKCALRLDEIMETPPDFFNYKVRYRFKDNSVNGPGTWQTILWKLRDYDMDSGEISTQSINVDDTDTIRIITNIVLEIYAFFKTNKYLYVATLCICLLSFIVNNINLYYLFKLNK